MPPQQSLARYGETGEEECAKHCLLCLRLHHLLMSRLPMPRRKRPRPILPPPRQRRLKNRRSAWIRTPAEIPAWPHAKSAVPRRNGTRAPASIAKQSALSRILSHAGRSFPACRRLIITAHRIEISQSVEEKRCAKRFGMAQPATCGRDVRFLTQSILC